MRNRAWKHWVIASILAAVLWAAGSSKAEEKAQPRPFNSQVAFEVYAVTGGGDQLVGSTPSEPPLTIPPCKYWYVVPQRPVDMARVRQEVEAQGIPGLELFPATDAGLKHLEGLTALQRLNLMDTHVTDAGLEHLKGLTALQRLDLAYTRVADAGLEHLKGLTALQHLGLSHTQVTDAGLEHLKGLTQLQYLALPSKVTDAGLVHLKGLTALQGLYLWDTAVTDTGLEHLKGLTALRELDLKGTKVTEAGVDQLKKSLPNAKVWR
jgi:hypothetical protein